MPLIENKDFKVLIDNKLSFDRPVKNDHISKVITNALISIYPDNEYDYSSKN